MLATVVQNSCRGEKLSGDFLPHFRILAQDELRDQGNPVLLGHELRAVPRHHVADFVPHHARHFAQVVGSLDQTAVNVNPAAGNRERVHIRCVHDLKVVLQIRPVGRPGQLFPELLEVSVDLRILQQRVGLGNFRRKVPTHLHFLIHRDQVDVPLVDARRGAARQYQGQGNQQDDCRLCPATQFPRTHPLSHHPSIPIMRLNSSSVIIGIPSSLAR